MAINPKILEYFKPAKCANNSKFISFEGIEGSGKSTQVNNFISYLENDGLQVHLFREPGGTIFGEQLRKAILDGNEPLPPISEAYLFASSRAQLLKQKVLPLLEQENNVVILDRYIDSSLAYQGIARGLGIEKILEIHTPTPLNVLPNITFYLEISVETSLSRQEVRGSEKDYFESEKSSFYKKLIEGYQSAKDAFPERIISIDGSKDIQEVGDQIKNIWKSKC